MGVGEGSGNLLRLQSGGAGLDVPTLNPLFLFPRDRLYYSRFHDGCGPLEIVELLGPWDKMVPSFLGGRKEAHGIAALPALSTLLSSTLMADNRAPGLASSFPSLHSR